MGSFLNGRALAAAATVIALTACGGAKDKQSGQSLVRVNDQEITVHQLNNELRTLGGSLPPGLPPETIQRRVIDSLVDRQLLNDEAVRKEISRDPEVMQSVERARSLVLAEAYMRKVANPAPPSKSEIEEYFRKNPELFTKRKLYEMRQIALASASFTPELSKLVESGKSVDEIAAWLDANKIAYVKGQASKTTADLPPQLLPRISELEKGVPFILKGDAQHAIASLHYQKDVPVSAEVAYQQIEQFLKNRQTQTLVAKELERLRAAAKIEYGPTTPHFKDKAGEQSASAAPVAVPDAAPVKDAAYIDRGVQGLK